MRTAIIIAAACALVAGEAAAQASAQATGTGSVTVMDPAQIAPGAAISVDPVARPKTGSRTATANAGSYTLTGQGGETFNLAVPSSLNLVRSGGGEEIQLNLTPSQASGAFDGAQGQVSSTQVDVGGAATVSSTAAAGVYEGELPVTLTYQ